MAKTENTGATRTLDPIGKDAELPVGTTAPATAAPAEKTPAEELAELKSKLKTAEALLAKAGVSLDIEKDVTWRMQSGLSRDQAIECARRQALYNKAFDDAKAIKDPVEAKQVLETGVRDALRTSG